MIPDIIDQLRLPENRQSCRLLSAHGDIDCSHRLSAVQDCRQGILRCQGPALQINGKSIGINNPIIIFDGHRRIGKGLLFNIRSGRLDSDLKCSLAQIGGPNLQRKGERIALICAGNGDLAVLRNRFQGVEPVQIHHAVGDGNRHLAAAVQLQPCMIGKVHLRAKDDGIVGVIHRDGVNTAQPLRLALQSGGDSIAALIPDQVKVQGSKVAGVEAFHPGCGNRRAIVLPGKGESRVAVGIAISQNTPSPRARFTHQGAAVIMNLLRKCSAVDNGCLGKAPGNRPRVAGGDSAGININIRGAAASRNLQAARRPAVRDRPIVLAAQLGRRHHRAVPGICADGNSPLLIALAGAELDRPIVDVNQRR